MRSLIGLLAIYLLALMSPDILAQEMNNLKLGEIIQMMGDSVEGQSGAWQFMYEDRMMIVITDEGFNRMRIISPIIEVQELTSEYLHKALIANFHTALDVKYAISDEVMWSVFLHPLKELSGSQFRDAVRQVYNAADSFGTTFSSTDLVFPGGAGEEKKEEKPKNKKM